MSAKLKQICSICGKKVKHLGDHMRYNHKNLDGTQRRKAVKESKKTPTFAPETVQNETSESTPSQMPLQNPQLDALESEVQEEEAAFLPGTSANVDIPTNSADFHIENRQEIPEENSEDISHTLFDENTVQYVVESLFRTFAHFKKEPLWELDEDESKELKGPLSRVVNKYLGKNFAKYEDELVLGTVLFAVFSSKAILIRKQKNQPTESVNNERRNQDGNSRNSGSETPVNRGSLADYSASP